MFAPYPQAAYSLVMCKSLKKKKKIFKKMTCILTEEKAIYCAIKGKEVIDFTWSTREDSIEKVEFLDKL